MSIIGINGKEFIDRLREQGGQQMVSHSFEVAKLMRKFAEVLGEDLDEWEIAGLFHDAGKIFVPEEILKSKGTLSRREREAIKHHVIDGAGVLWSFRMWSKNTKRQASHKAAAIACSDYHHAWYNGQHDTEEHRGGYYRGMKDHDEFTMKGEAIPFIARACALCDVFEAITANRSYDSSHTKEEALDIMAHGWNTQFEPSLFIGFFNKVVGFSLEQIKTALEKANVL